MGTLVGFQSHLLVAQLTPLTFLSSAAPRPITLPLLGSLHFLLLHLLSHAHIVDLLLGHGPPMLSIHFHSRHRSNHSSLILILFILVLLHVDDGESVLEFGALSCFRVGQLEKHLEEELFRFVRLQVKLFHHGEVHVRERLLCIHDVLRQRFLGSLRVLGLLLEC